LTADETRTRQLTDAIEARRAANERVEADARLTAELRTELETRLAELEQRRDAQKRLLREIRSRNELATSAVREREESAAQLTATAEAEARTARAQPLAMPADVEPRFRAARGRLPAPVNGRTLRGYGPYNDPLTGAPVQNHGVDIAATVGSPIRAVFDGVVSRAGYVRGFGQVVTVQHGAYATLYAHANGLRVATGDAVRAGDVLGNVGTTGLTDDSVPRLHFEVRYNGTPQDPAEWLAHEP
jgi:septal ring factor EnvC (AmiA/AmiB activator)